jgi:hypothetical protein
MKLKISESPIKNKPRNVTIFLWENNAYNAVIWTDGEYWICFDEVFDNYDLYDDDIVNKLKQYIKSNRNNFESFDDLYNQFDSNQSINGPLTGNNFGEEYPKSELTYIDTLYHN